MIKKNLNASLLMHLIGVSDAVRKQGDELTRQHGITMQQWMILLMLARDPNFLQQQQSLHDKPLLAMELAEALNVSRANITNLLNVLLEKKLIKQLTDQQDKRRKHLVLSSTGIKLLQQLETPRLKSNEALLDVFSKKDKESMIQFMEKAYGSIRNQESDL